jgi:hypothetical protein
MVIDHPEATIYLFPVENKQTSATEESGSTPIENPDAPGNETKESPRGFLQVGRRNLTQEELSHPAVQRFLIFEIERLDRACADTGGYVELYHDQRVTIASLSENVKVSRKNDILSSLCLAIGSAGIGAAPSIIGLKEGGIPGALVGIFSAVLLLGGIASRMIK